MPKDGQINKKEVRIKKARGQTPLTRENQNHTRNDKKQSADKNDKDN